MKYELELDNLSFSYGNTPVLDAVSLSYAKSDFLAIIGPNGGGKSTLLKLMIGLLRPTKGLVHLFGGNPWELSHRIAYVPQDTFSYKPFPISVLDVVLMGRLSPLRVFGSYSQSDKRFALEMLEKVGMQNYEHHGMGALSGGQRQRVYVARALATEAEILFLDEPTASIDTAGQIELFSLLKTLNQTIGVVMVSHDVNVVLQYATKVAHVNKTLYLHDISTHPPMHFTQTSEHLCPIELISATQCHHIHPKEQQ